jgi:hypothetical protein
MRAALAGRVGAPELELKSRNAVVSTADQQAIESFVSS